MHMLCIDFVTETLIKIPPNALPTPCIEIQLMRGLLLEGGLANLFFALILERLIGPRNVRSVLPDLAVSQSFSCSTRSSICWDEWFPLVSSR